MHSYPFILFADKKSCPLKIRQFEGIDAANIGKAALPIVPVRPDGANGAEPTLAAEICRRWGAVFRRRAIAGLSWRGATHFSEIFSKEFDFKKTRLL
ncbi:MAG: hypothetical protein ACRD6B_00965 [Bryobacteraceae bacterium]